MFLMCIFVCVCAYVCLHECIYIYIYIYILFTMSHKLDRGGGGGGGGGGERNKQKIDIPQMTVSPNGSRALQCQNLPY